MFLSVNRKIIYSILVFFILTAMVFSYTFYKLYLNKYASGQQSIFMRNNQYVSLLYENLMLKNIIETLMVENKSVKDNPLVQSIFSKTTTEDNVEKLSIERERSNELMQNYNEHYSALLETLRLFIYSAIYIFLSGTFLCALMQKWVINPVQRLSKASEAVSEGDLSVRVEYGPSRFQDEFYILNKAFNKMLDSIDEGVKEIKEKEQFLQSLIDAIPDGIRVIDKDYNIIIANDEYYKKFEENDCSKKCYGSFVDGSEPCNIDTYRCPVRELLGERGHDGQVVKTYRKRDKRYISINAAPLKLLDSTEYIVESIRDLSEDIKFSYNQKLSSIGFLAASVSHEMKNSLGAMRMILEGVMSKIEKGKLTKEEELDYMSMIHKQVIETIIVPERLLKLSRHSNDVVEEIDCIENLNDVVALLDYEAKSRGTVIDFKPQEDKIIIRASSSEFKIIFINLIQNSLKAIEEKGDIIIECFKNDDFVTIKVKDNGCGIEKENIKNIFDPFFSNGENSKTKGTGLGLSIVKSIVEKYRGEIKVYSERGVGTTFSLTFPIEKKELPN